MAADNLVRKRKENWSMVIQPKSKWLALNLGDVWKYRDLLMLFVRRDFVAVYKQTILGPAWFFIQPILTTITFTIIFGTIAKIPTDDLPQVLFYMSGITAWSYFADCINKTSKIFVANANIYGKVYFPRLITPLSIVISNLIKFGIQFLLFSVFLVYYLITTDSVHPNIYMLLLPVLVLMMAGFGMGLGLIISSMTTKYRDLTHLVAFGVQLLMYGTTVAYPLSIMEGKSELIRQIVILNPMTPIIEAFRYAFMGAGELSFLHLAYSATVIMVLMIIGIVIFNRTEKSFMDTV